MQSWLNFLQLHGATAVDPDTNALVGFAGATASAPPATDFMTPLTDFGLIRASGADAANFLHNQLTNDVEHLDATTARLAGYCTPKGRMLASFLVWKSGDAIHLQLPRQLQPSIQKRLQMFVLRAKVTLADATEDQVQIGLVGAAAATALHAWFPELPRAPYEKIDGDAGSIIRLADAVTGKAAQLPRYLWITPAAVAETAWPVLATRLQPAGIDAWRLSEIRAGIPSITAATQEQFVPQMINFEAIGGVNFQKGCYPGQEIVARSQYLGKLKRRMWPATVPAATAAPGTELFSDADPEQACGMVVNAAPHAPGEIACLVEIKLAALDAPVHLGAIDGPLLHFHDLPYALTDAERPDLR